MSSSHNKAAARMFYRRRQILKEELEMAKQNRKNKKLVMKSFGELENKDLQSMIPQKEIISSNVFDHFEFVAECDGVRASFCVNIPIDKDKIFPEEILREVITYGVCCKASEFHLMEKMLKSIDHKGVQSMISDFAIHANEMRKAFENLECSKSQTIESLEQLHEKLKDIAPNSPYVTRRINRLNQTQSNQEINMSENTQSQVEEIQATAAEAVDQPIQSAIVEEAAQPQPETTTNLKEEPVMTNVNETIDQAAAATANAAQAGADTVKSAASDAADAAKETVNKTTAVAKKAAEETKGFFARHQKKLYIGLGLIGFGGAAYFGWKKFGGSIVDAGEAAVEVVVDTAGQAAS